jgi:hypothetical protein
VKGSFTMKNKRAETKFKSTLGVARHLFSRVACLGAVILICSTAPAQNLFVSGSDAGGVKIFEFTPNEVQSIFASGLNAPNGLAFDGAGNLFVADAGGSILKFTPDGAQTTFASGLDGAWALAFDSAGNLFVTDGLDIVGPGHAHIYKFSPNGTRTTFASGLLAPEALAFDSAGNLFVLEGGDIDGLGAAIFKFTPAGKKSTFASPFLCIGPGLAIDSANNLFVPDWCTGNIYKFTPLAKLSTFVSGSGLNENFAYLAFQPVHATPTPTPTPTPTATPPPTPTPTPPTTGSAVMLIPSPGSTFTSSSVTFHWSASSATAYVLLLGSSPNGADIYNSGKLNVLSTTVNNIPTDGRTIYATLLSEVNNSWTFKSYTYKAFNSSATPTPTPTPTPSPTPTPGATPTPSPTPTPTPTPPTTGAAVMLIPPPGSTFSSSTVTFTWSAGSASAYFLFVGSSLYGADIYNSGIVSVHSKTVNNIPTDGRTIYVTLGSLVNGSWTFKSYTYKAF